MTSNLPDDLKVNWLDNDIVMPLDVNTWSSAINVIKKVIPNYSANGNFYTATFSNNIYSLTPITTDSKQNNTSTAYIDGMTVIFKCPTTNTNSCSVNVNGLGNKQIKNLDGSNIASGGIIAGNYIELVYDVSQGYFRYTDSELTKHINNTSNPHKVTKAQVGLGNCDNTSDANKPISTATQNALNNKANVNLDNLTSAGEAKLTEGKRSIGEIITSTLPLMEAGLHLLDGALIQGSGSYSAFVTYIAGLVSKYPNIFTTESNWQNTVSQYGVCGKFVYDNINNTVRLPKIIGIISGTNNNEVGGIIEAGLPNITGSFNSAQMADGDANSVTTGAFIVGGATARTTPGSNPDESQTGFSFDASRSSSIYGNSTTVQPQTIKVLYYIVVATSAKNDIQVDIDEIAADLNGKADVDLSNTVPSANFANAVVNVMNTTTIAKIVDWVLPDYSKKESKTLNTEYHAECDGWLAIQSASNGNTDSSIRIGNSSGVYDFVLSNVSNVVSASFCTIPIRKGQYYKFTSSYGNLFFIPLT